MFVIEEYEIFYILCRLLFFLSDQRFSRNVRRHYQENVVKTDFFPFSFIVENNHFCKRLHYLKLNMIKFATFYMFDNFVRSASVR